MDEWNHRFVARATSALLWLGLCGGALSSCSTNLSVQREARQIEDDEFAVQYSIVFIIHGDNDYLYHDSSGNEYSADLEALEGAKKVAMQNPSAEVFIFHQRADRHFMFLFPLDDGEFFFYKNGKLCANESYSRDNEQSPLDQELVLYDRFRSGNHRAMVTLVVYSGHEIPELDATAYDMSEPDRTFGILDFAVGLKGFTGDSGRFDIMILSTCFGGTPYTIGALGSVARYIIASPDNLHLSYFDLSSLERLDQVLSDEDMPTFARRFAQQAFDRLTQNIQTAVSVVVYDVDRVQEFLRSVHGSYESSLIDFKAKLPASMNTFEHCDCGDLPAYELPTIGDGVDVFYRPARFGRLKNKQSHSGWECLRERAQAVIPRINSFAPVLP